jgi:L-ribulose-5-phosphate 3-epimerase
MKSLFSKLLAAALLAAAVASASAHDLQIGVQTWTLRNLNFDQVVDFCVKNKIKHLQLIAQHIDPKGKKEDWEKKKAILDKNGLVPYTFGVNGTSLDKEDNRKLFEFAKFMGMKLIIVEPNDFKILDNLEELAKEYDMRVAIHNHGIKSMYGNPLIVQTLLKHRDPRIGVCLDAGWVASGRFDVVKTFKDYGPRVFDIHLKDKKVSSTANGDVATDVFIGEGDANIKGLLKAIADTKWQGVISVETDNNLKDPTEHMTKALSFIEQSHGH